MGLQILDVILWICGIRGPMPRHDGFGGRHETPFVTRTGWLKWAIAITVTVIASLALILWLAIWLSIRLL